MCTYNVSPLFLPAFLYRATYEPSHHPISFGIYTETRLSLTLKHGNEFIWLSPATRSLFSVFCFFCFISFHRSLILKGDIMCFGLGTPPLPVPPPLRLPVRTGKQLSKCERKATEVRRHKMPLPCRIIPPPKRLSERSLIEDTNVSASDDTEGSPANKAAKWGVAGSLLTDNNK